MRKYQKQNTFGIADAFQMIWNTMVSVMNIGNFVYFIILSKNYDVNTILQRNEYVNSALMSSYYFQAQIFDSFLVIMNMLMMIQFTQISRRVSLVFKIISITSSYLLVIVVAYVLMLVFMSMIVW